MEYYEGLINNTEFFTTAELAKKLKMNVQVITRKVQAGEISAYKIGKDWRIPEQAVYEWLERNSNHGNDHPARKTTTLSGNKESRPNRTPESPRRHRLEYILAQFEPNRLYDREAVVRVATRVSEDPTEVIKELLHESMLEPIEGRFRRRSGYKLSE